MPHLTSALRVGEHHIKTTGKRDNKLLILPVGMAAAFFTAWYIVYPVGTRNIEWYVLPLFYDRQVTPTVKKLG